MTARPRPGLRGALAGLPALLLAVAVSAALPAQSGGGDGDPGYGPPPVSGRPQPVIQIPEVEHDWGEVLQGNLVSHSFVVKNRGTGPLRILKVKSNCGCTTAFFSEEIAPGGEGRVELRVATGEVPGSYQRKNATVFTNDVSAGQVTLWMRGNVIPLLETDTPVLKLSGVCEESKETTFRFRPGTEERTRVLGARFLHERIELTEFTALEEGGAEVRVASGPDPEPRIVRDELVLKVQVGEGEPVETHYPVVLEHLDRVRITPGGNIVFYRRQTAHLEQHPDRVVSKQLVVRALREDLPVVVTGARVEGGPEGLFSTEVREISPGQHYVVEVRVLRTLDETQVKAALVIDVDDPARPTRTRELFAQFRLSPPTGQ